MKDIRHFLNLDQINTKDIHSIMAKSHILKKKIWKN